MHAFPSNITRDEPPITRDYPPSLLTLQGRSLTSRCAGCRSRASRRRSTGARRRGAWTWCQARAAGAPWPGRSGPRSATPATRASTSRARARPLLSRWLRPRAHKAACVAARRRVRWRRGGVCGDKVACAAAGVAARKHLLRLVRAHEQRAQRPERARARHLLLHAPREGVPRRRAQALLPARQRLLEQRPRLPVAQGLRREGLQGIARLSFKYYKG